MLIIILETIYKLTTRQNFLCYLLTQGSIAVLRGGENLMGSSKTDLSVANLGRTLFGGVLAYMALDNFRDMKGSIAYAESMNVPEAEKLVPFSSGMLLFGALGIALGRFRQLSPGAVITWFIAVTPQMHDFWNMEGDQRDQQRIHFLKNLVILGAALFFLGSNSDD